MGNEASQLLSAEVSNETPAYKCDNYTVYQLPGRTVLLAGDASFLNTNITKLKRVRHPGVTRYVREAAGQALELEPCEPLCERLDAILASMSREELVLQLYNILKTLKFLHESQMSMKELRLGDIFVTSDSGEWKIFNLTAVTDAPSSPVYVAAFQGLCKELAKSNLATAVFTAISSSSAADLLHDEIFVTPVITISNFMRRFHIAGEEEKELFCSTVVDELRSLNDEMVARLIFPQLLSRVVFHNTSLKRDIHAALLTPRPRGGLLSPPVFARHIVPFVCRLFTLREVETRLVLLIHFQHYADELTRDQLEGILQEVLVSSREENSDLVAESLRVLSLLVPLLGADRVIGTRRTCLFSSMAPRLHTSSCDANSTSAMPRPVSKVAPFHVSAVTSETDEQEDDEVWDEWPTDINTSLVQAEPISNGVLTPAPEISVIEPAPAALILPRNTVQNSAFTARRRSLPKEPGQEFEIKAAVEIFNVEDDMFADMVPTKPVRVVRPPPVTDLDLACIELDGETGWGDSFDLE